MVPDEVLVEDPQSKAKLKKWGELRQDPEGFSGGAFVALNVHSGSP